MKKNDRLGSVDPKLIVDLVRIEGPTVVTLQKPSNFAQHVERVSGLSVEMKEAATQEA
jgi:hypothetical protein